MLGTQEIARSGSARVRVAKGASCQKPPGAGMSGYERAPPHDEFSTRAKRALSPSRCPAQPVVVADNPDSLSAIAARRQSRPWDLACPATAPPPGKTASGYAL